MYNNEYNDQEEIKKTTASMMEGCNVLQKMIDSKQQQLDNLSECECSEDELRAIITSLMNARGIFQHNISKGEQHLR